MIIYLTWCAALCDVTLQENVLFLCVTVWLGVCCSHPAHHSSYYQIRNLQDNNNNGLLSYRLLYLYFFFSSFFQIFFFFLITESYHNAQLHSSFYALWNCVSQSIKGLWKLFLPSKRQEFWCYHLHMSPQEVINYLELSFTEMWMYTVGRYAGNNLQCGFIRISSYVT